MAQPERDHHDQDSNLQRMTRICVWRIKRTGVDDARSMPFYCWPFIGQEKRSEKNAE
jgi:hypothetical protein